jgi:hypothetical protein
MTEHICEICFRSSDEHPTECGNGNGCSHWPPLCCEGCSCRSFEEAAH